MKDTSVTVTGRLSYPNLFTAKGSNLNPDPRYSTDILIPKTDPQMAAINKAIEAAVNEGITGKWGGKKPANIKSPLHDGDASNSDYANGCWILRPWSKAQYPPKIMDRSLQPIIDQSEIYGGCYAAVSLNFYAYDFNGQRGINAGFDAGVVKTADGEPFGGGRTSTEEAFAGIGHTAPEASMAVNPITGLPY